MLPTSIFSFPHNVFKRLSSESLKIGTLWKESMENGPEHGSIGKYKAVHCYEEITQKENKQK